jgi:large subunit ribosomal protein L17
MYRNLVTSLFEHERVRTTDAKAKGVRSLAEKMITLGKRGEGRSARSTARAACHSPSGSRRKGL